MKKINYDELQTMLDDGYTQAHCAKHFGCSEAAISKAVKRLKAGELPESMANLTPKQQRFALSLAEGKSQTGAALDSFDCSSVQSAKAIGSKLAADPDIMRSVGDLMAQEGIPRRRRIKRLGDLIESSDLTAVGKGLDMSWKLDGSYSPKEIDMNSQMRLFHATIQDLKQYQREKRDREMAQGADQTKGEETAGRQ